MGLDRLQKSLTHMGNALTIYEEQRDPTLEILKALTEIHGHLHGQYESEETQEFDWSQVKPGAAFQHAGLIYWFLAQDPHNPEAAFLVDTAGRVKTHDLNSPVQLMRVSNYDQNLVVNENQNFKPIGE